MSTKNFPQLSLGHLASIMAAICWSAGNVIVAGTDLPGLQIAFWRLLLGGVLYSTVYFLTGQRMSLKKLRLVALPGILLGLELAVFFTALRNTTVANATMIGALQTIVLLAVASRRFQESVTRWLIGASLIATGGVALVILGASNELAWSPRGDFLAFAAMILFSVYFIVVKNVRGEVDTFTLQSMAMLVASVTVFPIVAVEVGTVAIPFPSWEEWVILLILLLVPGTGHSLMNWAHLHIPLSFAGMMLLSIPVLSSIGAWLFLNEHVTVVQAAGMVIVIATLILVAKREAEIAVAIRD
ncbi:MAG TPA: DMT family transporter [Acidimicrobiales bacterium]|nr:DMT family transporter [Acidimicrobiales bacterium]